jgi:hypothetical protein
MNGLFLDHCFSWPCNNIAEDDETYGMKLFGLKTLLCS